MASGGKRKGAGRKPEFDEAKKPHTVRLPKFASEVLITDFGGIQAGVQHLVISYIENQAESD